MMELFERMLTKANRVLRLQLAAPPQLSTRDTHELFCSLEVVRQKLQNVCQHAFPALGQDRAEVVEQIHGSLEETLDTIETLLQNTFSPLNSTLIARYQTALAFEMHKLEVLMCILKISDGESFDTALPAAITQRATKVSNYIDFELSRCGRRSTQENNTTHRKWHFLNDHKYLQNVSEDFLKSSKSLRQSVNTFGRFLQLAKAAKCTADDRYFYLVLCARFLVLTRASSEYTQILQSGGALIAQDYLTEFEIDVLAVLIELPTQWQTRGSIAQRTQTPNSEDSQSIVPPNTLDDQDIFTWPCNKEPNLHFSLRRGPEGALLLRSSRCLVGRVCLRSCDLREAQIVPYYGTQSQKSYECDLIIKKKKESPFGETQRIRFYFKHNHQLKRFQALLSGWVVTNDFGSGVPIRILKKGMLAKPVTFVGRLQLWDRPPEQSHEVIRNNMTYALTGLTNTSQTTVSSNATIRAAEALPFTQISTADGREILMNRRPPKPLLVLLEESSERNILALSVPPPSDSSKTRIDKTLCKCQDTGSDCSRCFIRGVQKVHLKVGRYEYPQEGKVRSWVEVDLGTRAEREKLTYDLEVRWNDYNKMLQQSIDNSRHVSEGHLNTLGYQ